MEYVKPYHECKDCGVIRACERYQELHNKIFCPKHIKKLGQCKLDEF